MIPALVALILACWIAWLRSELRRRDREVDYLRRALLHAQTLAGLR